MPVKAQYIVRVSVLAVALGVAAAVANTPGVASAEPTDSPFFKFVVGFVARRLRIRPQDRQQARHQRVPNRQQIRRPRRLAPHQVRRLGLCRVRLPPKPVRPPHRVTLRRQTHALEQTHALGLCRVRAAHTPAQRRRATTPPHQLGRRPPKPRCPLPSPRLHPPSPRPRRYPSSNQTQRCPPSNPTRSPPPRSRSRAGCTKGGNTGNPSGYSGGAHDGCAAR